MKYLLATIAISAILTTGLLATFTSVAFAAGGGGKGGNTVDLQPVGGGGGGGFDGSCGSGSGHGDGPVFENPIHVPGGSC